MDCIVFKEFKCVSGFSLVCAFVLVRLFNDTVINAAVEHKLSLCVYVCVCVTMNACECENHSCVFVCKAIGVGAGNGSTRE